MERDQEVAALRAQIRRDVTRRVRARVGFYWHLAVFIAANLAIVAINLRFSPSYWWFVWPLGGWGFGLAAHAFAIFQVGGGSAAMIEAEIEREFARRGIK